MKKEELIDIITNTIVSNGEKGITAELLSNVLIEIVNSIENTSSVGGSLTIKISEFDFALGTFASSESDKIHNAEVFVKFEQSVVSGSPIMLGLDLTEAYKLVTGTPIDFAWFTPISIEYISEENAPSLGLMEAMIVIYIDGGHLEVLKDGSVNYYEDSNESE